MSALNPPPASVTIDPTALRLVLFGMPDAGKSSLLGALAQAAETQGRALHGHLNDVSHGLTELRRRLYDDRQTETLQEIVPYPVRFSPYGQPSRAAVLYDCDGRAANDLLTQKRSIEEENRDGTLAGAVLAADALILAIDASAPPSQLDDDFREFLRFLRFLEKHRSREHAVGGLPVYLVLTKCDLLVRDGTASRAEWESRIAERQREVMQKFKAFLSGHGVQHGQLGFGTLDLEVRATAVRRPALTDAAPQAREPYGVAELFYTAFGEGQEFQKRQARSRRRLRGMVASAASLLAALITIGVVLAVMPRRDLEYTLLDRISALKAAEGPTAATRLGPKLEQRLKEWRDLQSHPQFAQLDDDMRHLVRVRLDEGHAYVALRDELVTMAPPSQARSLAELLKTETRLRNLEPPAPYQGDWTETDALQRRDKSRADATAIRAAVGKLTQFYFTLANRASVLLQTPEINAEWGQAVRGLQAGENETPIPKTDPVAAVAYEYDDVAIAAADWQKARDRLLSVRDLAGTLGMFGDVANAPLAFPPPAANADIPALGALRWQQLRRDYPNHARWSLSTLPDAVRPEVEKRWRRSVDQATRDGQRVVFEKLQALGKKQLPTDWARVGEALLADSYKDWRDLNTYLLRLADASAADPVLTTAEFLRRTSFDLLPQQIKLRIPDTVSDAPVRPAGDLALILQKRSTDDALSVALRLTGEPERDKQSVVYTFTATGKTGMTFRPGDLFYAELPVRKGERDLKLTWASSRTQTYQFERVFYEPRLHAPDQSNIDGTLAVGVTLRVTEGQFPMVPAMVPLLP